MPDVVKKKVHTETTRVGFTWPEVEAILTNAALEAARQSASTGRSRLPCTIMPPDASAKVELKQLTEGSPSYNTSKWSASVVVERDLDARPTVEAAPRSKIGCDE